MFFMAVSSSCSVYVQCFCKISFSHRLTSIIQVARRRVQIRQKILRIFGEIPNIARMAYRKVEILPQDHPQSESLRMSVRNLQRVLLNVLPYLIDKLNPGSFSRWNDIERIGTRAY